MVLILRSLLALLGMGMVAAGALFLIDPVRMGIEFGLVPQGNQGLSSLRGDFSAYFWVAGGALIMGAWKQRGDVLLVAAALLGITLTVRALSLVLDGTYPGWELPMAVEALTVILALFGYRVLARPAT